MHPRRGSQFWTRPGRARANFLGLGSLSLAEHFAESEALRWLFGLANSASLASLTRQLPKGAFKTSDELTDPPRPGATRLAAAIKLRFSLDLCSPTPPYLGMGGRRAKLLFRNAKLFYQLPFYPCETRGISLFWTVALSPTQEFY
uniref:Uncharacterized protein n=1 Tax=Halimeda minima TaxID=170427 RepID=A0A386AYY8_9CHLO|nr:hypothetical protein [Halimeda minima]